MQFEDYRIEIIPDTEFRLDGGAMFGVIPKTIWERENTADEKNRIRLNMNCLFIETPSEKILIETGIGEKWSAPEEEIYGISRKESLRNSLDSIAGCAPEEISMVINTHLHFDHAGGNTILNSAGKTSPQFSNAKYLVSKSEFEHANSPSERDRASYRSENWTPLIETGQLCLMPDNYSPIPGLSLSIQRGHNETMQTFKLKRADKTLFGFSDLVPMRSHVRLPWIAGYDLFPLETLEAKRTLLNIAADEAWICLLYHEPDVPLCTLTRIDGKLVFERFLMTA